MDVVSTVLRLVRGTTPADADLELAPPVHLARHVLELDDGHRVGVAVAGHGVPLVVVHGFGVESLLYAQPLGRLAALGFRVVALDVAGHGDSEGLGAFPTVHDYADLLDRAIAHLGIERAVLAGHSMGGRLVADVAALDPERVIGVLLVDAIVGGPWERMRCALRWSPPLLAAYGGAFALDLLGTVPIVADVEQARKLGSRAGRSIELHAARPWRVVTPAQAILRAGSSLPVLGELRDHDVYVAAIHGDRDRLVPLGAGRDAALRTGGDLVVVHGGTHSWLLRCPETLPAIVGELLGGRLGEARDAALVAAGADPATATPDDVEAALLAPDSLLGALGGGTDAVGVAALRRAPALEWTVEAAPR
jgi:pimeloyl-ACP methyl ester carboxylesterase